MTRRLVVWMLIIGGPRGAFAGLDFCPPVHLAPSEFVFFANFGHSVAIRGDFAAIGAHTDVEGTAYAFRRVNGSWIEEQELLASDLGGPFGGDLFGWDVATDGQFIFVSAINHVHAPGLGSGSVFVFRHDGGRWIQVQELWDTMWDPNRVIGPSFGYSIALDGEWVIIGATNDTELGVVGSGSASIYRFDGVMWVFEQKLVPDDPGLFNGFGFSVALRDDVAVVGTPGDDQGPTNSGSAYVYRRIGSGWVFEQKIVTSDTLYYPDFGTAVAIDGDTIIVGSSSASIPGIIGLGKVYVYQFDGKRWTETQQLTIAAPFLAAVEFGEHLALEGDWAIIGDDASWLAAGQHGAAHIYHREDGRWTLHHTLLPQVSPPWLPIFGRDVALSGNQAMVGAPGEAAQSGSAYVYVVDHVAPDLNCDGFVDGLDVMILLRAWGSVSKRGEAIQLPADADLDGNGVVNGIDLAMLLAAWG